MVSSLPRSSPLRGRSLLTLTGVGSLVLLLGCPATQEKFDEFVDRQDAIEGDTSGGGGMGACTPPAVGEADGLYIFALSARVAPKTPVLFETTLTTADDGGGNLTISLSLLPIDAETRSMIVGAAITVGPIVVDPEGAFTAEFPPILTVAGSANPISGTELEATNVVLSGTLCTPTVQICGSVTGNVTKPLPIDLAGSSFSMEPIASAGVYPPQPQIDCAGNLADAL